MNADRWNVVTVVAILAIFMSGCGILVDNTRYYGPSFSPRYEVEEVCPYPAFAAARPMNVVVTYNKPGLGGCGPSERKYIGINPVGVRSGLNWIPIDGGGASAGTYYSMETMFPEDIEKERLEIISAANREEYPSYHEDEVMPPLISNGLHWEYVITRRNRTRPRPEDWYQGAPSVPKWVDQNFEKYIYKHSDGWWLRIQGRFREELKVDYPGIYESRRETLRKVVESVKIEPMDPARIECRVNERGRESCRYVLR